jgi:hypothetical protein
LRRCLFWEESAKNEGKLLETLQVCGNNCSLPPSSTVFFGSEDNLLVCAGWYWFHTVPCIFYTVRCLSEK